ncbi:PERMeable eggshell [Caenorhabditis elegans]|uniref:PERMeable eggshell n=1 Tax=Caenorhabditis elegans TaxID=6239 RepID=O44144_CAEEL|nr:PERMeable eggshell [Caenorhabditis elegans]CCD67230.2 PERMeable eggshell [Caenorhabditis elegans]|eukprot:NP_500041.2 PERMeable eggshell [Caenorhabditis elegans]
MKTVLLLTVASLAAVLGAKPTPTEEVKSEAAAGRYGGRPSYGGGGYGNGGGYGYPAFGPGYWQPLIQDRFVCDLDASVLLVVDSVRRHHRHPQPYYGGAPSVPANRAVRVKCSEVATHDEDSCNFCCQQTARRDTSLPNDQLFGFLAITKDDDDETFKRSKRGADDDDDNDSDSDEKDGKHGRGRFHKVDSTYLSEANWEPKKYHKNVKCVCCAPRSSPAAQNPSYNNNAAQSPPTGYNNNANAFVQPQPVAAQSPPMSASQPLVDLWQSENTAPSTSWGAAPAAPSTSWGAAPAAPPTWGGAPTAAPTWGAANDAPPAATPAPVAASNAY